MEMDWLVNELLIFLYKIMKKILFIAPSSFPVFGAEAIVNIKLLRAFTRSGNFKIDLVSRSATWNCYPTQEIDAYGVQLNSVNVIVAKQRITVKSIWQHIKSFFLFNCVYRGAHWAVNALPIIKHLVKNNDYDYVLTKDGASFLLGFYLKKHYGLKWIATWNDPYPEIKYPVPYGKGQDAKCNIFKKMQIRVMNCSDITIFPSERLSQYMQGYLNLSLNNIRIIPHVVNEYNNIDSYTTSDKLRIIHSGNIKYPRDPKLFLSAIKKFIDRTPNAKIEITILGPKDVDFIREVENLKLQSYIIFKHPVPYLDSLKILSYYDIALIIEAQCKEGIFLPTKVSDAMQCRKPIYAISPQTGVLHDLYQEGYVKYFSDNTKEQSIIETFSQMYNDFLEGKITELDDIPLSYRESSIINQYLSF